MSFEALIGRCNQTAVGRFANVDVLITLSGVTVRSIRGIFDEFSEVVSPFEADQVQIKPVLSVQVSDFAGITSAHGLMITRDGETTGKDYTLDGKPRPDGHGMTLIYLAGKR